MQEDSLPPTNSTALSEKKATLDHVVAETVLALEAHAVMTAMIDHTTDALSSSTPELLNQLFYSALQSFVAGLGRLGDNANSRRHKLNSLARLLQSRGLPPNVRAAAQNLSKFCASGQLREYRNKVVAHAELPQAEGPGFRYSIDQDVIDDGVERCRAFLSSCSSFQDIDVHLLTDLVKSVHEDMSRLVALAAKEAGG